MRLGSFFVRSSIRSTYFALREGLEILCMKLG